MVVGIRSLSGDFSPRLVDFCRDDPRYENYLLVEEKEGSRDGTRRQRRLHQLLKLPHVL